MHPQPPRLPAGTQFEELQVALPACRRFAAFTTWCRRPRPLPGSHGKKHQLSFTQGCRSSEMQAADGATGAGATKPLEFCSSSFSFPVLLHRPQGSSECSGAQWRDGLGRGDTMLFCSGGRGLSCCARRTRSSDVGKGRPVLSRSQTASALPGVFFCWNVCNRAAR